MDEMRKLLIIVFALTLVVGCTDEEVTNTYHSSRKIKPEKVIIPQVIEKTTVIKTVYVSEEDFSTYDTDDTITSTYWYVQFSSKVIRGYNIIEIHTPYADIGAMIKRIKDINGIKADEYTQIEYLKQVSFESYAAFQKNPG